MFLATIPAQPITFLNEFALTISTVSGISKAVVIFTRYSTDSSSANGWHAGIKVISGTKTILEIFNVTWVSLYWTILL